MKHSEKKGFSIILALGMMILMTFIGLYLLEYMVPFARATKGVENASKAFYEAYSGLEHALYDLNQDDPSLAPNYVSTGNAKEFSYTTVSEGTQIPRLGFEEGNSEYDSNWNILSPNIPISLKLPVGITSFTLRLRVPNFDGVGGADNFEVGGGTDLFIWQLTSSDDSITIKEIGDVSGTSYNANIFPQVGIRQGEATNAIGEQLSSFYNGECNTNFECVMRVSLVKELIGSTGEKLPYLEYQIVSTGSSQLPLSHAHIRSSGVSYGFGKKLYLPYPQSSTNAAFDFAVFQ